MSNKSSACMMHPSTVIKLPIFKHVQTVVMTVALFSTLSRSTVYLVIYIYNSWCYFCCIVRDNIVVKNTITACFLIVIDNKFTFVVLLLIGGGG